jgi:hypothetical protein
VGNINFAQIACPQLSPNVNPVFTDVWASGAVPDVTNQRYDDTTAPALTNIPVSASCQSQWSARCRTIVNYPTHIHPLWATPRTNATSGMDRTCTNCHNDKDAGGAARVPDAQLDLSDGPSTDEPDHFKSYRELLFPDDQQELNITGTALQDVQVFVGNLIDPDTGLEVLDAGGNPIPVFDTVPVVGGASMSVNGSRAGRFMAKFLTGGSHAGDLTPAEMRLIAEWLDVGAQYFNSPFDAPEN